MGCSLLFEKLDNCFHVAIGQPQVWHAYLFVFLEQRNGGWIVFRNELVRFLDEALEPVAVTRAGDAQKIRTDLFTVSNGMARGTVSRENVLSRIQFHRLRFSIALSLVGFRVLPIVKPIANEHCQK